MLCSENVTDRNYIETFNLSISVGFNLSRMTHIVKLKCSKPFLLTLLNKS